MLSKTSLFAYLLRSASRLLAFAKPEPYFWIIFYLDKRMKIITVFLGTVFLLVANSSVFCGLNQDNERYTKASVLSKNNKSELSTLDLCEPCDIAIWASSIRDNLNSTSNESVAELICTIDKRCSENEEFSSISNEYLFSLLRDFPLESLKALTLKNRDTQLYILEHLENPIHDGIDIPSTITQLKKVQDKSVQSMKIRVLSALAIASIK